MAKNTKTTTTKKSGKGKDKSTKNSLSAAQKQLQETTAIKESIKRIGDINNITVIDNLSNPEKNKKAASTIDDSSTTQILYPRIQLTIYSEHNTLNLVYDTGNKEQQADSDAADALTDGVISFQTKNALEDDSASFSIVLAGNYKWDYVVYPNDIIIMQIFPQKSGITYADDYNANIMTGMVTEVHRIGNYDSDSFVYQIAGKSLANAFMQYQIGLVEEVESSLSSMGWLWDTNMAYSAETTDNDSGGGSGDADNITVSGKNNAEKIWNALKDMGFSDAAAAGALGNIEHESAGTFKPNIWEGMHVGGYNVPAGSDSGYGFIQWTDTSGSPRSTNLRKFLKKHNAIDNKDEFKWELYYLIHKDPGNVGSKYKNIKSASDAAKWWSLHIEAGGNVNGQTAIGQRVNNANKWYKKLKGSHKTGSDDSSSDDKDSDSKSTGSGNTDATSDAIQKEMGSSKGVSFLGNTCATIEKNVIDRFLPYMRYDYGTEGWDLSHFLTYDDMTSWDDYEKLQDSSQFTNFSGSLYELQDAILHKPFVEMFYEMDAGGKSHIAVRRTPFEPEDWNGYNVKGGPDKTGAPVVERYYINSNQIMSEDVSKNNDEIYSVFNVNPATANYTGIKNSGELGSLPQFNQQLVNLYGYAKLETTSLYLEGTNKGPLSNSDDTDNPKKTNKKNNKKNTKKNTKKGGKNTQPSKKTTKKTTDKGTTKSSKKTTKSKTAVILASKGTHYDASDVQKYLKSIKLKTLRQKQTSYAEKLAEKANNISGNEAANLVQAYLLDNQKITQTKMDSVLNVENGGGISATGTKDINYKDWLNIIKEYGNNNQKQYMSQCKGMFDNAEDEVLTQLYSKYLQGGNKLSQKDFKSILKEYKVQANDTKLSEGALDLKKFTQMLYNWYCEDINFYSGDITVIGSPEYRLGSILVEENKYYAGSGMEYYIESIEHTYSMTSGYQTVIGVTRGLDNFGKDRFSHLWGQNQDFLGGYMGEAALDSLAFASEPTSSKSSGDGGGGGGAAGGDWVSPMTGKVSFKYPDTAFGTSRGNGKHDGCDFNSYCKGYPNFRFVHGGTIKYLGTGPSFAKGGMMITESKDGYCVCYQEYGPYSSYTAKGLKVGDTVKAGQHAGKIISSSGHVHIGVTKGKSWKVLKAGSYSTKGFYDVWKLISGKSSTTLE